MISEVCQGKIEITVSGTISYTLFWIFILPTPSRMYRNLLCLCISGKVLPLSVWISKLIRFDSLKFCENESCRVINFFPIDTYPPFIYNIFFEYFFKNFLMNLIVLCLVLEVGNIYLCHIEHRQI